MRAALTLAGLAIALLIDASPAAALWCVNDCQVKTQAKRDCIAFDVKTPEPVSFYVAASTDPPNKDGMFAAPHNWAQQNSPSTSWKHDLCGLKRNASYYTVVRVKDKNGVWTWKVGGAATYGVDIHLKFDSVTVHDDSDDLSDCDCQFYIDANGKRAFYWPSGLDSIGTGQTKNAPSSMTKTLSNVPDGRLRLSAWSRDNDSTGSIFDPATYGDDDAAWDYTKKVSWGPSGIVGEDPSGKIPVKPNWQQIGMRAGPKDSSEELDVVMRVSAQAQYMMSKQPPSVGHLQPKMVITRAPVQGLTGKGKLNPELLKAVPVTPGLGGGGGGSGPSNPTPPATPTIVQPIQNFATCNAVPFQVTTTAPPSDPITALELVWRRYKGSSCGPQSNNGCWANNAPGNWAGVHAQSSINTTIPRSQFAKKGLWRVKAKAKNQSNLWGSFTNWREFRVKKDCP